MRRGRRCGGGRRPSGRLPLRRHAAAAAPLASELLLHEHEGALVRVRRAVEVTSRVRANGRADFGGRARGLENGLLL